MPATATSAPVWLKLADAAARYSIGRTKLRELMDEGRVDFATVGRSRLVSVASMDKLLAESRGVKHARPGAAAG